MSTEEAYKREKIATRLCAFYEHLEGLISLYTEMKVHYPEVAELLEDEHPFLKSMNDEAARAWAAHQAKSSSQQAQIAAPTQ